MINVCEYLKGRGQGDGAQRLLSGAQQLDKMKQKQTETQVPSEREEYFFTMKVTEY